MDDTLKEVNLGANFDIILKAETKPEFHATGGNMLQPKVSLVNGTIPGTSPAR